MPASRLVAERRPEDAREQQLGDAAVTAVVCTYNGERFLEQQLLSILSQSHPVAEVIVSDDASQDGTVELARRVLEASDRAYRIYTRDEPLRVSGNFEFALGEARTDYLATSDQDDVWHPKKVEHLLAALVGDDQALLAHSDALLVDEDGEPIGGTLLDSLEITETEWRDYNNGRQLEALTARNFVTGATMMLRASLVFRAGNAPAPWIHDEWLATTAALVNGLRVVREPLIDYRQHGGNQIGQTAPTLQVKIAQATKDGSADQLRRYRRAVALLKRVSELGGTPEQEAHVRRKVAHERQRLQLPTSRIRRIPRVIKWTLRGRYGTYSRGSYDIARDLFQSLEERDKG
ncbi:glycosyltransferase family 2 protein [Pseudoclavibacter sp. AY1F1]|uniref:glycosyltransferase family 2 protein n=1 Tax=Pseudoclavibacter sp. AY1F1 TaxID=2080583 RepID=UPI000CE7ED34|nr:glycosyltransferase family 2 protein [Pseudoclavibacter sp. AY1F1]PPF41833.1 glycosyltransferase family 2 protein [Pseudoclavibacter sp. AY1F1]